MNKPLRFLLPLAVVGIGLASLAPSALAGGVDWSINIGAPVYYGPPPVVYQQPPAVIYTPPPVVYAPRPVYPMVGPGVVYSTAPGYYGYRQGPRGHYYRHGHHHRDHDRR